MKFTKKQKKYLKRLGLWSTIKRDQCTDFAPKYSAFKPRDYPYPTS